MNWSKPNPNPPGEDKQSPKRTFGHPNLGMNVESCRFLSTRFSELMRGIILALWTLNHSSETHLQMQIGNQAGDSESHKKSVCAYERSQGIGHFLHLFIPTFLFLRPVGQTNWSTLENLCIAHHCFTVRYTSSDPLAARLLLLLPIVTLFQLPVHDLANHRGGQEAEQLQHAKDGRVQADWRVVRRKSI